MVCFDPKWKRLYDLKYVLIEKRQAIGDCDKGLYEVVANFLTVVQQMLGIFEADGLHEEALVLGCKQIAFKGLADAWDGAMGGTKAIRACNCERNKDVFDRTHKIVLNKVLEAKIEVVEEVICRKMVEMVAKTREKNITLQALLKEHGDLCELPAGQPLAQKTLSCIFDAMAQHKECRKGLVERCPLRRMELEVRHSLARKVKLELMEELLVAS